MTSGVPPERQCTLPSCDREAADALATAGLCPEHQDGLDSANDAGSGGEDGQTDDGNPGSAAGESPLAPGDARRAFTNRLQDARLDTRRFIDVHDGEKRSTNHTQHDPDSSSLHGNYGVYGGAGAGDATDWILVDIDVDDYDGERAPDWIPETFTVASPHTDGDSGGQFYVAVPDGTAEALKNAVGTANPAPSWGGVRIHNQYCVGPGSQLDGCSKDWCDDCADADGGYYCIKHDDPIAFLETDEFVEAVQEDMPDRKHEVEYPDATRHEFDDLDIEDYEPDATGAEESTGNVRDILAALDRIDARHVAEDTIVHRWNREATTSGNYEAFVPTWGKSANGTANIVDDRIWQDTGGNGYGGPVTMALIDTGDLRPDTASPPSGELFWKGVEHLRELGYSIPEYDLSPADAENVAVLPETPSLIHASGDWNWRHVGRRQDGLTLQDVRDRTQEAIETSMNHGDQILIESLPSSGKSTGARKTALETDTQITYFAPRREVMEEFAAECRALGLDVYTLPSFPKHCTTASGEHGDEIRDKVLDWYNRDAPPKEIHAHAEGELGRPLPCQEQEGQECPYSSMWRFDPDDFDVIIGHYNHAHKETVTTGRVAVFDEFPGSAYETTLSQSLETSVTAFLKRQPAIPYDDYADLMDGRSDDLRRAQALEWFTENDTKDDPFITFDIDYGHAKAPRAVYTIIAASQNDLGNGW